MNDDDGNGVSSSLSPLITPKKNTTKHKYKVHDNYKTEGGAVTIARKKLINYTI